MRTSYPLDTAHGSLGTDYGASLVHIDERTLREDYMTWDPATKEES